MRPELNESHPSEPSLVFGTSDTYVQIYDINRILSDLRSHRLRTCAFTSRKDSAKLRSFTICKMQPLKGELFYVLSVRIFGSEKGRHFSLLPGDMWALNGPQRWNEAWLKMLFCEFSTANLRRWHSPMPKRETRRGPKFKERRRRRRGGREVENWWMAVERELSKGSLFVCGDSWLL